MHGLKIRRVDVDELILFGFVSLRVIPSCMVVGFPVVVVVVSSFFPAFFVILIFLILGLWPLCRWLCSFIHCRKRKWYRRKPSDVVLTRTFTFANVDDDHVYHASPDTGTRSVKFGWWPCVS